MRVDALRREALDARAARLPLGLVLGVDVGELVELLAVDLDDQVRTRPAEIRPRPAERHVHQRDWNAGIPEDLERAGFGIAAAAVVRDLRVAITEGSEGGSTPLAGQGLGDAVGRRGPQTNRLPERPPSLTFT